MASRILFSKEEMQEMLDEIESSGSTINSYLKKHGIPRTSFYGLIRRYGIKTHAGRTKHKGRRIVKRRNQPEFMDLQPHHEPVSMGQHSILIVCKNSNINDLINALLK